MICEAHAAEEALTGGIHGLTRKQRLCSAGYIDVRRLRVGVLGEPHIKKNAESVVQRIHDSSSSAVTLRVIPTRPVVFPFLSSPFVPCPFLPFHPMTLLVTMRLSLFGAWRFPAYDIYGLTHSISCFLWRCSDGEERRRWRKKRRRCLFVRCARRTSSRRGRCPTTKPPRPTRRS